MESTERSWFRIGPRIGGLIIGYTFTYIASFQLIFSQYPDILSIFSVVLLSLSVRWNCGIISKTPEFLWTLLWFVKLVFALGAAVCITLIIMEFFVLAVYLLKLENGFADADDIMNILIFLGPTMVLMWYLSSYMDSIYTSVKELADSNGHPRTVEPHSRLIQEYLEKLKELSDKIINKSSELLEKPFKNWHTNQEDKNVDIENSNFLNGDFCEIIIDPKTNQILATKESEASKQ